MTSPICTIVGAGPGVSMGVAQRFGREGYTVALVARRVEALTQQVEALKAQGIQAQGFAGDVADDSSVKGAFDQIKSQLGETEVLVYNPSKSSQGGIKLSGLLASVLMEDLNVNVAGALRCLQQTLPAMREQRRGTILFTGGGLALNPRPDYGSLAMGKSALRNLCFSLAQELNDEGIHVATVTIAGYVQSGTHFDPDKIAEAYWTLHRQPAGSWETEIVYRQG